MRFLCAPDAQPVDKPCTTLNFIIGFEIHHHAITTWDEPSPEEKERAMGFQTSNVSHTKVIRLQRNVILGRGMDLNSLTWLLVTYVFFQMYTTLALI
jgi:hypothetical protein